jgi:hypothetical protein
MFCSSIVQQPAGMLHGDIRGPKQLLQENALQARSR